MTPNNPTVGDTGTVISLNVGVDVSAATLRQVFVKKPSGAKVTWTAAADGAMAIQYTVQTGDLDVSGAWKLQAYVVTPSGSWRGAVAILTIESPI